MNNQRKGDWVQTFTGRAFWPLQPHLDEIDIVDIAHGLAYQCRFMGHCSKFYSVAQHSCLVSELCPNEFKLHGLLHDASEAYLCDIPRPVKHLPEFKFYRDIEAEVQTMICIKYDLSITEPGIVKMADNIMLATEMRDLMCKPPMLWAPMPAPISAHIVAWSPDEAFTNFLAKFHELIGKQNEI